MCVGPVWRVLCPRHPAVSPCTAAPEAGPGYLTRPGRGGRQSDKRDEDGCGGRADLPPLLPPPPRHRRPLQPAGRPGRARQRRPTHPVHHPGAPALRHGVGHGAGAALPPSRVPRLPQQDGEAVPLPAGDGLHPGVQLRHRPGLQHVKFPLSLPIVILYYSSVYDTSYREQCNTEHVR